MRRACDLTIEEIERHFGFDKCRPIRLTPSEEEDMASKDWTEMQKWYEKELREFFDRVYPNGV